MIAVCDSWDAMTERATTVQRSDPTKPARSSSKAPVRNGTVTPVEGA